jgi:hypothetical protein
VRKKGSLQYIDKEGSISNIEDVDESMRNPNTCHTAQATWQYDVAKFGQKLKVSPAFWSCSRAGIFRCSRIITFRASRATILSSPW